MKKMIALCVLAISLVAGSAFAAGLCSQADLDKKMTEVNQKVAALKEKDAEKGANAQKQIEEKLAGFNVEDFDGKCEFLDKAMQRLSE